MSEENKYRTGIDESPLTQEEYEYMKNGGFLYRRVTAPKRNNKKIYQDNVSVATA